jgi:hypothetical protein
MNAVLLTPGRWEHEHGDQCGCRLLASAVGADPSTVDFTYCRAVLQKRWRVRCNHGGGVSAIRATPELPLHDPHDAVQAILVANAISPAD